MNLPFRSSTDTGVVTRLVSTRTTSSSSLGVGFAAGGGGGILIRSVGCDCFWLFAAGAVRERLWAEANETRTNRIKRQTAVLNIGGSSKRRGERVCVCAPGKSTQNVGV